MTDTNIDTNENHALIASDRVEGTAVFNTEGERLGSIHNFMVNKRSGKVAYAVLKFGGFLGIGDDHYPLPWDALTYDTDKNGYVVDLDKDKLKDAPRYADQEPTYDRAYGERIYGAYGLPYPV